MRNYGGGATLYGWQGSADTYLDNSYCVDVLIQVARADGATILTSCVLTLRGWLAVTWVFVKIINTSPV